MAEDFTVETYAASCVVVIEKVAFLIFIYDELKFDNFH